MAFDLPDHWVWDFWFADDGEHFHLFYLHAPKALGNSDLRHRNARIGHATSSNLTDWLDHGQSIPAGAAGSFDGSATWTGSIVKDSAGVWHMFYTGARFLSQDSLANIEAVGLATSTDLFAWNKAPGVVCAADSRFYETLGTSSWPEEAWRDPWVFYDIDDRLWHMLITARSKGGVEPDRGVMAHATSTDLLSWTVQPPLSAAGSGFAHLEVFQLVDMGGRNHLVFSCDTAKLCGPRTGQTGGVWTLPVGKMPGRIDFSLARLLVNERLYGGRIAKDRQGQPWLLAFNNTGDDGRFSGGVSDPMQIVTGADGYLQMRA
ncbi:glycosyl hydrolase family 32 [Pelagibacterium limicola]|uniref:glycosyl hydrolase family 32 n=1 Tax=Pelagibacterium limicola TaxID=2791022 RepID=UPI0018AFF441